eukprot:CAMPEP_0172508868 /NCGR_PEP_ID=MMETSP1066-20121228/215599_1 /TAXON_ID=671091 /ORGANISM="Coscinodiscus wailesii, Strain CCMP2513" /LENGTH=239 /DNA_ID=CAMNT_0013287075 /DNA_START=92 /DNA_END=808 /DNA_ORIENTATION=-
MSKEMNNTASIMETAIHEITQRCDAANTPCSELLAAFVARTIPSHHSDNNDDDDYDNPSPLFALDNPNSLTEDDVLSIINQSVHLITQKNSPSIETIKMQVQFTTSRLKNEKWRRDKEENIVKERRHLVMGIVNTVPRGQTTADYEFLTRLHRDIFSYIMKTADCGGVVMTNGGNGDGRSSSLSKDVRRGVEREVASAVDSVLPVIALKCFVFLNAEEKRYQIDELESIVLGIRLFNKR